MEYVYGLRCGEYVKIGYTTNPAARMSALSAAQPGVVLPADLDPTLPSTLLFLVPGDRSTEATFHHLLAPARVAGEWFRAAALPPLGSGVLPCQTVPIRAASRAPARPAKVAAAVSDRPVADALTNEEAALMREYDAVYWGHRDEYTPSSVEF